MGDGKLLAGCAFLMFLMPKYPLAGVSGMLGIGYCFFDCLCPTFKKYYSKKMQPIITEEERIFESCKLVNYKGETPKLINIKYLESCTEYIFNVPIGLSYKDFIEKKEALKMAFRSNLEIKLNGDFTVSIKNISN